MTDKSISNFMTTQKLFKPTNYPYNTIHQRSQLSNSFTNNSTNNKISSKSHHYHLKVPNMNNAGKNDGGQGKDKEMNKGEGRGQGRGQGRIEGGDEGRKRGEGIRELVGGGRMPGRIQQHRRDSLNVGVEDRNSNSRSPKPKSSRPQPIYPDSPTIQQQSPTTWQTIVINSSRKYFDSCRSQALQYLYKLSSILQSDKSYLSSSITKIHSYIRTQHESLIQSLKAHLYSFIDQSLQSWKQQSLSYIDKNKIQYISQLLQLNTQVQERCKQIQGYKVEIEQEREWKNRVGDLLKESYEEDLVYLSQLCRRTVGKVEGDLRRYWETVVDGVEEGVKDSSKKEIIIGKLSLIIQQQCIGQNKNIKQQKIQPQTRIARPIKQLSRDLKPQYTQPYPSKSPMQNPTLTSNPTATAIPTTYPNPTATPITKVVHTQQISQFKIQQMQSQEPQTQPRDKYGDFINRVYPYNREDEDKRGYGNDGGESRHDGYARRDPDKRSF